MSRIGKKPIKIPEGVKIAESGSIVTVKGPLGEESQKIHESSIGIKVEGDTLYIENKGNDADRNLAAFHGLYRSLIANMVKGVSKGFEKDLEITGVGYRAVQKDKGMEIMLGFSHNINFQPPKGVEIVVVDASKIKVKGINKQKVGQVAANIRKLKPPEPYKGKGIKYKGEHIRRKAGKAGKK